MFRRWGRKRGLLAMLMAFVLVAVVGVAAIAIDGGLLLDRRQQVQAAADAAALAAASELYARYQLYNGVDVGNYAKNAALANAADNGFDNDGTQNIVTVNIPPTSGPYASKPGYAEVRIQYNQPKGFGGIFGGNSPTPVSARAVALGKWTYIANGIIVLDPTSPSALSLNGGASLVVQNAGAIIDSSSSEAATATGGYKCFASASAFDITGVPGTYPSSSFIGTLNSGVPPTPDPLAYLPVPDPTTMIVRATNTVSVQGTQTLQPGWYKGGITCTGSKSSDQLTLVSGVYYLEGIGFNSNAKMSIVGSGVMFYIAPGAQFNLGGNGNISLSPMTTGIYRGITVFQDRSSTIEVKLAGQGTQTLTGTIYAPKALVSMVGNGATSQSGSQVVCYNMNLSGNGTINVNWKVEETARIRVLRLIE